MLYDITLLVLVIGMFLGLIWSYERRLAVLSDERAAAEDEQLRLLRQLNQVCRRYGDFELLSGYDLPFNVLDTSLDEWSNVDTGNGETAAFARKQKERGR